MSYKTLKAATGFHPCCLASGRVQHRYRLYLPFRANAGFASYTRIAKKFLNSASVPRSDDDEGVDDTALFFGPPKS